MLRLNQPAPDFKQSAYQKGVKGDFKEVSLKDFKGKWVILLDRKSTRLNSSH